MLRKKNRKAKDFSRDSPAAAPPGPIMGTKPPSGLSMACAFNETGEGVFQYLNGRGGAFGELG